MAANVGRVDIFQRQATRFKAVVVTGQTIPVDYGILRQASLWNLARSAVESLTFGYSNREQKYRSQDCETNTESVPTGHSCLQDVDFDLWLFYTRRNTVATVLRILVLVAVFYQQGHNASSAQSGTDFFGVQSSIFAKNQALSPTCQ